MLTLWEAKEAKAEVGKAAIGKVAVIGKEATLAETHEPMNESTVSNRARSAEPMNESTAREPVIFQKRWLTKSV